MTNPPIGPYVGLGEAIKELRLERGVTRNQVKEAAEISLEYLGKIEQGKRKPQPDVLARIAAALGISTAGLLARARSARGTLDPAAGSGGFLIGSLSAVGASLSIVGAAREIRRQRSDRDQLLEELEHRLDSLSDDELALLVASIPEKPDGAADAGQADSD